MAARARAIATAPPTAPPTISAIRECDSEVPTTGSDAAGAAVDVMGVELVNGVEVGEDVDGEDEVSLVSTVYTM